MDKIIILDFGSQTAQLIGRRIRDMGVYTEILPGDAELGEVLKNSDVKGVILSGSPDSVNGDGCAPDRKLYDSGLPLLGICYGLQRMTVDFGGKVETLPKQEYGRITVTLKDAEAGGAGIAGGNANGERAALFLKGFRPSFTAWISHSDSLTVLAPGFREFGTTESGFPAIVIHDTKPWFGLQFHPELTHCENGDDILSAFTLGVCGCEAAWTMESYIEETRASLKAQTGGNPVLLLISGGVDSTVTGAMLLSALDKEQVHLMYMDTGLMRKDETKTVKAILEKLGAKHLHIVMCENEFLAALKGITEPEAIHFDFFRASSSLPAPSVPPMTTVEAVKIPPKMRKKIFAMVQPAAIPATTSAPPRLLYKAVIIVSELTHEISETNIIAERDKISFTSFILIRKASRRRTKKSGFVLYI